MASSPTKMDSSVEAQQCPPTEKNSVEGTSSSGEVDTAWKFLDANRGQDAEASESELAALRRKIDWHIVPIMFFCYMMQFLDKVILNVSSNFTHCIPRPPS